MVTAKDGMIVDLRRSFDRAWSGSGAARESTPAFDDLVSRYAQPWRRYHTLQHLHECIAWFERAPTLADDPAAVELALWFHDAVYEPRASDNEERSARLAASTLLEAGAAGEAASRVARLVLATRHALPANGADERLVTDIDLSILGAAEPRFDEYERQVREEYAFVPEAVFRSTRATILRTFAARDRLYRTQYFFDLLEAKARRNLARALGRAAPGQPRGSKSS